MPEAVLTLRRMHVLQVEVLDDATGEHVPLYNVHLHHEAGMAGDECGTVPRGVRGKGAMKGGKLSAIASPWKVQVEAPGYEGKELEVEIPPEGPVGTVKVEVQP